MSWFKKKPKHGLYKVYVTYEVLVMANSEWHAVNRVREFRNELWAVTRNYIGQFSMSETAKAKKS